MFCVKAVTIRELLSSDSVGEDAGDEPPEGAAGGADGRDAAETSRAGETVGPERRPQLPAAGRSKRLRGLL